MKRHVQLIVLMVGLMSSDVSFGVSWFRGQWTDVKLDKALAKMEKAADAEHWRRAIKHGERALEGCRELRDARDRLCITIMSKNASYYYREDLHPQHAEDIEAAYLLSRDELGIQQSNTRTLRNIHYRVLLRQKRFRQAIPVLQETLQVERVIANDPSKILELTLQLYGLYHLTDQTGKEEMVLKVLLPMVAELLGEGGDEYHDVAEALAETYCTQEKYYDFFEFVREFQLDIHCKVK